MNIKFTLIITMLFSLIGCGKKNSELKKVKVVENTWGIEFKSTPIASATNIEQQVGKAVTRINYIQGGSATGFFISSDGLMMTNEHVISRESCSEKKCQGIQIIRNFAPNGDYEVFSKFKVLAQNKDLDYAIIKVELPEGKTVPFLKLDKYTDSDSFENMDLRIVGHPFGSSLRTSKAIFSDINTMTGHVDLKSVAISGNSGSPIVDISSGSAKVVGLYNSSLWDKNSINKDNGSVKHVGGGKSIKHIVKNLEKAFQTLDLDNLSTDDFSKTMIISSSKFKDILPEKESISDNMTFNTWVHQYLGTDLDKDNLDKVFKTIAKVIKNSSVDKKYLMSNLLFDIANLNDVLDEKIKIPSYISDIINSDHVKDSFDNFIKGYKLDVTILDVDNIELPFKLFAQYREYNDVDCNQYVKNSIKHFYPMGEKAWNFRNLINSTFVCSSNSFYYIRNFYDDSSLNYDKDYYAYKALNDSFDSLSKSLPKLLSKILYRQFVISKFNYANYISDENIEKIKAMAGKTENMRNSFFMEYVYTVYKNSKNKQHFKLSDTIYN